MLARRRGFNGPRLPIKETRKSQALFVHGSGALLDEAETFDPRRLLQSGKLRGRQPGMIRFPVQLQEREAGFEFDAEQSMLVGVVQDVLERGAGAFGMLAGKKYPRRGQRKLKPKDEILTLCRQRARRICFLLCVTVLALRQQRFDQHSAGMKLVVGFLVLVKPAFVFAQRRFGIARVLFFDGKFSQRNLGFSRELFFARLFSQRQRFLIRLASRAEVAAIDI